jgi:hypothetical protein
MSNLTKCNYCSYEQILRNAKEKTVELKPEDGGISIYIDGKFASWYMELPDHYCCD